MELGQHQQDKKVWEQSQVASVLFGNALGAIVGNLVNISLVAFLLFEIYPGPWLWVWFFVGLGLNGFRLLLYLHYKKVSHRLKSERWLNTYRATALLSGTHFGILAFFFFSSNEPVYQTLVACFICGSVAAAVGTHGVDSRTYRLFLYPACVPLLARCVIEGSDIHLALAVMVTFLMVVMARCARQTQRTMLENIRMSYSLNYRATHDTLVALFNREEFKNEYERTRELKEHAGKRVALIFIDLDNFKKVNDNLGHEAGDQALIKISNIIRASIRKDDIAARFGGDEFILLLYIDAIEEVNSVCDKITLAIDVLKNQLGEESIALGASIGVGLTDDMRTPLKALLKASDRACYEAKSKGKGQVCFSEVLAADRVDEQKNDSTFESLGQLEPRIAGE